MGALTLALCASQSSGGTFYVNGTCGNDAWTGTTADCNDPNGNGPKEHIQAGIDAAASLDEVIVASGTYTGIGNRDIRFDAGGTVRNIRLVCPTWATDACVIDCQVAAQGIVFHNDDFTDDLIVEGFTVTNGQQGEGGGIEIGLLCEPVIKDCIIENCTASAFGGGIIIWKGATPLITGCTIRNNHAGAGGGGIQVGVGIATVSTVIEDCTITGNDADGRGGGVAMFGDSTTTIKRSTIADNWTDDQRGGGIYVGFYLVGGPLANAKIINCIIAGNVAGVSGSTSDGGGGLALEGSGVIEVVNSLIVGNSAPNGDAGGIFVGYLANVEVDNTTIVGNTAFSGAGGIWYEANQAPPLGMFIENSIIWGNDTPQIGVDPSAGNVIVKYTDVQGGWRGTGNIDAEPLFADEDGPDNDPATWADNDYRLLVDPFHSPCIDVGSNALVPADVTDVDQDGDSTEPTPDLDLVERILLLQRRIGSSWAVT